MMKDSLAPETVEAPAYLQCPYCRAGAFCLTISATPYTPDTPEQTWYTCQSCGLDFGLTPPGAPDPRAPEKRQVVLDRLMRWYHRGLDISELGAALADCRWITVYTSQGSAAEYSAASIWADCESRTALLATMMERLEESKQ